MSKMSRSLNDLIRTSDMEIIPIPIAFHEPYSVAYDTINYRNFVMDTHTGVNLLDPIHSLVEYTSNDDNEEWIVVALPQSSWPQIKGHGYIRIVGDGKVMMTSSHESSCKLIHLKDAGML
jgi:hypothetical protein